MIRLDDVQELVKPELAEFKRRYDEAIKTGKSPIIDQVVRFLAGKRGKMLRPTLTYLSARLLGESNERTHFAAVVVELLHNATLLHDDVVDGSDKRRGMPSLNAIFGNKISVLFGDYLLANSLLAMLECGDTRVFEVLARTARRLAKGELDQAARSRNLDMDEETYYRMVSNKTGALVAASCVLGGLSNRADESQVEALRAFGEALGVAFQIQDDLLDYFSSTQELGKIVGSDLAMHKATYATLKGSALLEGAAAERLRRLLQDGRPESVAEIRDLLERGGVPEAGRRDVEELALRGRAALAAVLPAERTMELGTFSDWILHRTF